MKKFIIIIALILISSFAYADLVDYENFEDYSTYQSINSQADKWSCLNADNYNCSYSIGSPTLGYAENVIMSESSNKFLRLNAVSPDGAGNFYYTALEWDNINSSTISTLGNSYYTLKSRMRINAYMDDYFNGTNNKYITAGIGSLYGTQIRLIVGGDYSGTCDGDCQKRIAYWSRGGSPPLYNEGVYTLKPINADTSCNLADGDWHDISLVVYMNATAGYKTTEFAMYQDGVLCYYDTPAIQDSYISSRSLFEDIAFSSAGAWSIDIDDIFLYENQIETGESNLYFALKNDCPYDNCLFYDNYNYQDNASLTSLGYYGTTTEFFIYDEKLYGDDNYIEYDFTNTTDMSYTSVENNIIMQSLGTATPNILENETYVYQFTDYCSNGLSPSTIIAVFTDYNNVSSLWTGYETQISFYRKSTTGNLIGLGSMIIPNGAYFGFSRVYDMSLKKYWINFYTNENIFEGLLPNTQDILLDFASPCTVLTKTRISQIGTVGLNETGFMYGVDEIVYIGGELYGETGIDFVYTNESKEGDDGVVDTEVTEELHNFAYQIGFKTTGSKLLFWLIVFLIFGFAILRFEKIPNESKFLALSVYFVFMTIAGFYLGFVPTAVFILLLLTIAGTISFTFVKIFKGSEQ